LLIVVELIDLVHLLFEWLLDSVGHLKRIHNRITTSLSVHFD
jgi:hypothetical protein